MQEKREYTRDTDIKKHRVLNNYVNEMSRVSSLNSLNDRTRLKPSSPVFVSPSEFQYTFAISKNLPSLL